MLSDPDRHLFIAGGRITRMLADYFFLHMQVIRPNVTNVQSISNTWPHYLLNNLFRAFPPSTQRS